MRTVMEAIDLFHGTGGEDRRLRLPFRESVRFSLESTCLEKLLSWIDEGLHLGDWWFRPFAYTALNPDGTVWSHNQLRYTLAGYVIPWGLYTEYYDDGTKQCEGLSYGMASFSGCKLSKHKYWLPDGTQVSQDEYMKFLLGPDADECHDPAWEL